MLDLETKLRDHFRSETTGLVIDDRLDTLVHRRRRRRHRAQNLAAAGLAVVVLSTLLLGTSVLLADDASKPIVVGDDLSGTDGESLFLVPSSLPQGFELAAAFGPDDETAAPLVLDAGWDGVQRWVQFDGEGHPAALVDVQWGPGPSTTDDALEPFRSRADEALVGSDITFLHAAEEGWAVGRTQGTALASAGRLVRVSAVVAPEDDAPDRQPTPLPAEVLGQVVDGLVARHGGGIAVADPPDGFELAGEWPGEAHVGDATRGLLYREPGGRSFEVWMANDSEVPVGASMGTSAARRLQVRGRGAVSTPYPAMRPAPDDDPLLFLDGEARFLEWTEPGGDRVVIAGLGLTEADLIAVADSLEAVDADAWYALQGEPDPGATTTTTSPSEPESESEAEPSGGGMTHISGSYEGIEHYTLLQDQPCDLDHEVDTTWHLDDGSTWQFHHEYCGHLDGDLWSYGGGTVTLTAPDGSTITGDEGPHAAQAPTFNNDGNDDGISLRFESGTGRFAGITGGCNLHNEVTQVELGTQLQAGTFTCDFIP